MAKPTLGARIRAARTELGITQPALAAALNIPYRRLQDIELDKKAVDTNLANRFERQLFDKVKARRRVLDSFTTSFVRTGLLLMRRMQAGSCGKR